MLTSAVTFKPSTPAARSSATPAALDRRHRCRRGPLVRHRRWRAAARTACAARNRLGRRRHAGQTHAHVQRPAGRHAATQPRIERAQPDGVAKGAGVLQRTLQHLRVDDGRVGLAEGDAAASGELAHLRQHLALQGARERAPCGSTRARCRRSARVLSISTRPGSSSTGSVSGERSQAGHAAGHRQPFRSPACGRARGRARAAAPIRSTRPGNTQQPAASMVRLGVKSAGAWPMVNTRPAAMCTSAVSSRPLAGSITRPCWMRIFMISSQIRLQRLMDSASSYQKRTAFKPGRQYQPSPARGREAKKAAQQANKGRGAGRSRPPEPGFPRRPAVSPWGEGAEGGSGCRNAATMLITAMRTAMPR